MSFLKITDPKKRDFIVNVFLRTTQNIQHNFLSQRVGEVSTQYEYAKVTSYGHAKRFKIRPLSELKPIREGMKNLPKATTFPQFPSITAYDDGGEEEKMHLMKKMKKMHL